MRESLELCETPQSLFEGFELDESKASVESEGLGVLAVAAHRDPRRMKPFRLHHFFQIGFPELSAQWDSNQDNRPRQLSLFWVVYVFDPDQSFKYVGRQ